MIYNKQGCHTLVIQTKILVLTMGFSRMSGYTLCHELAIGIFAFLKVTLPSYNFRVPVYKGVPLPSMKVNRSVYDDYTV